MSVVTVPRLMAVAHESAASSSSHSQPSLNTSFWSLRSAVHVVTSQLPVTQSTAVVCAGNGFVQLVVQVPQCSTSAAVLISQPSVCLLALQSDQPLAQAPTQEPAVQSAVT